MLEYLIYKCAVTLRHTIDCSTALTYFFHLQLYLIFCKLHMFSIKPIMDTLFFFIIFMSHYIKLSSINFYLSGICYELQFIFPDVCTAQCDPFVVRTLTGCKHLYNMPIVRKALLTAKHLCHTVATFLLISHDNMLFVILLVSGFLALHCLGELVSPNCVNLCNWCKIIICFPAFLSLDSYSYTLLSYKADHFFQSSQILMPDALLGLQTLYLQELFAAYLISYDWLFPLKSAL